MISVHDSGSGIPADHLLRIFDPFFTTKEVGHGSGLGLSVLHGIVHSANGHVEVKTNLEHGTEFRVYLPPHTCENPPQHSEVEPETRSSLVRGHVMVVDDDAIIVKYMTALLESFGCQVTGMTSATEALQMFQNNPYCVDLVMTDQTMPALSGIELARAMLACRPDIPIVLSTGYSNVIDEDMVRQIGVRRFLTKPVPARVLANIVAEYLTVRTGDPSAG
jgi:CheY-like chemotaxis protein